MDLHGFKFFLLFKIDNSQGKIGDQRLIETEKMVRCRKCEVAWCSWRLVLVVSMGRWIKVGQGRKLLLDFGLFCNWSHSAGWKICKCDSFTNLKNISMTLHCSKH